MIFHSMLDANVGFVCIYVACWGLYFFMHSSRWVTSRLVSFSSGLSLVVLQQGENFTRKFTYDCDFPLCTNYYFGSNMSMTTMKAVRCVLLDLDRQDHKLIQGNKLFNPPSLGQIPGDEPYSFVWQFCMHDVQTSTNLSMFSSKNHFPFS